MFDNEVESGLFVAAFFDEETNQAINKYMTENKIPNAVMASSLHTTIVYSKIPVPEFEPNHSVNIDVDSRLQPIECWEVSNNKKCLVLKLFSPYLQFRFQEAMECGATYDYAEYSPHITLSYDVGDEFDPSVLPQPEFTIRIIGEYCELLDPE